MKSMMGIPKYPEPEKMSPVTNRQRVMQFNREVLGIEPRPLGMMDAAEMSFSEGAIREELVELRNAFDAGDLVGVVDALVDLDFFLRGIVYKHGITPEMYSRIFAVVHEANMRKVLGKPKESRCQLGEDAIKPDGWESPEDKIRAILEGDQ